MKLVLQCYLNAFPHCAGVLQCEVQGNSEANVPEAGDDIIMSHHGTIDAMHPDLSW